MRHGTLAAFVASVVLPVTSLSVAAQTTTETQPIGRVTAAFGIASIHRNGTQRTGDLHSLVHNGERIRTDGGGVTVLLSSRVVLKIDHDTSVTLNETSDELHLTLERGTVHVFVGRRPFDAGPVCVQDPQVRAETADGVFLASYNPDSRSGYYACEHSTITVEPRGAARIPIAADKQLVVDNGVVSDVQEIDRSTFNGRKHSLDRLGQVVRSHGNDTFRERTRVYDTQLAINQLAAAGWIDSRELQAKMQEQAARQAAQKEKNSEDSESNEPTDNNANEQQPADEASEPTPLALDEQGKLNKTEKQTPAHASIEPVDHHSDATDSQSNSDRPTHAAPPANGRPDELSPPRNDGEGWQNNEVIEPRGLPRKFDKPNQGNGGNGSGGSGSGESGSSVPDHQPPVDRIEIDLPATPPTPGPGPVIPPVAEPPVMGMERDDVAPPERIDLPLNDGPGRGGPGKAKLDLDRDKGGKGAGGIDHGGPGGGAKDKVPKLDPVSDAIKGGDRPAPKLDLPVMPKLDLTPTDPSSSIPTKTDILLPPPGGAKDIVTAAPRDAILPPSQTAPPPPRLDLDMPTRTTPKLDLNLSIPTPVTAVPGNDRIANPAVGLPIKDVVPLPATPTEGAPAQTPPMVAPPPVLPGIEAPAPPVEAPVNPILQLPVNLPPPPVTDIGLPTNDLPTNTVPPPTNALPTLDPSTVVPAPGAPPPPTAVPLPTSTVPLPTNTVPLPTNTVPPPTTIAPLPTPTDLGLVNPQQPVAGAPITSPIPLPTNTSGTSTTSSPKPPGTEATTTGTSSGTSSGSGTSGG